MSNSGFVLLDKIAGETSFKALFPLKRVFSTKRVGHAGTLDLRASGLIIAATGRCTRLLPFIEAKDKCYSFRLHLGYETDTLEWDGEVVEQDEANVIANPEGVKQSITREALEAVLPQFTGDIEQVPPKYCAVKINGVRASDLMERGRNIELKPRKIHIGRKHIELEFRMANHRANVFSANHHMVNRALQRRFVKTDAAGGVALRVEIHKQYAPPQRAKAGSQIYRRSRLPDAALLIRNSQHLRQNLHRLKIVKIYFFIIT